MDTPEDRKKLVVDFFKEFEEKTMIDILSTDETINRGYSAYLDRYRKIKDTLITNVGKIYSPDTEKAKQQFTHDITQFLNAHNTLSGMNIIPLNNNDGQTKEFYVKNTSIQYNIFRNHELLSQKINDEILNPEPKNQESNNFEGFFKSISSAFKKKNIEKEKTFLCEISESQRKIQYQDSFELLNETKLPYISFQGVEKKEQREDQSRRILNATREAFHNIGLPTTALSTNQQTGLLISNAMMVDKSAGAFIQIDLKHVSTGLLNIPMFNEPKDKDKHHYENKEREYHIQLKQTIAHEVFHSMDRASMVAITNEEVFNKGDGDDNSYITEAASIRFYDNELKNIELITQTQEVLAQIYAGVSKDEYLEQCIEKNRNLEQEVAQLLIRTCIGSENYNDIPKEEKEILLKSEKIQDLSARFLANMTNSESLKITQSSYDCENVIGTVILELETNSTHFKQMTDEQKQEIFSSNLHKIPELLNATKELAKSAGMILSKEHLNSKGENNFFTHIKPTANFFINNDSPMKSLNDKSYEKDMSYWTSPLEVMARVAQATTTPYVDGISQESKEQRYNFLLSKEAQQETLKLIHSMAKTLGIEPTTNPEEAPISKNSIVPFFRSKTDGFLNRTSIVDNASNPYERPGLHLNDSYIKSNQGNLNKKYPEAIEKLDLSKFNF